MTIEELEVLIEGAESELLSLKHQLRDALIAASPFVNYGQAAPIVVYRKKNGEWGEREYTLYSWDLPEKSKYAA